MSLAGFRKAPVRYFVTKSRLVVQLLDLLNSNKKMIRPTCSWIKLVNFACEAAGGFLRPLQVHAEIERAMGEIEKLNPRFILEIGTANGGTFFLFSRAADPDALLVSLDLPARLGGGGTPKWKSWILQRLLLPRQTASFIRDDSHASTTFERVKRTLDGNPLDLLFLDGDHTYEGVKADFDMYSSLVRPGGLIVFHDILLHEPANNCQVDQFWAELKLRFPISEIVQDPAQGWAGIGLVRYSPLPA